MGAIHRVITFGRHTLPHIVFLVVGIDPTPSCQNNLYFLCIVSHVIDSPHTSHSGPCSLHSHCITYLGSRILGLSRILMLSCVPLRGCVGINGHRVSRLLLRVSVYHCLYLSRCYPTLRYAAHRLLPLACGLIVFTLDVISQQYDIVIHTLVPKDWWHSGSAPSPV